MFTSPSQLVVSRFRKTWSYSVTEYRRILIEGAPVQVVRVGEELVAPDGRKVSIEDAINLAPSEPTKILAVHMNYQSRTDEFMTKLPLGANLFS